MSRFAALQKASQEKEEKARRAEEAKRQEELLLQERQNKIDGQQSTFQEDVIEDFIDGFKAFLGLEPESDDVQYEHYVDEFFKYDIHARSNECHQLVIKLNVNGKEISGVLWSCIPHDSSDVYFSDTLMTEPTLLKIMTAEKRFDEQRRITLKNGKAKLSSLNCDVHSEHAGMRQDTNWEPIFEEIFAYFQSKI